MLHRYYKGINIFFKETITYFKFLSNGERNQKINCYKFKPMTLSIKPPITNLTRFFLRNFIKHPHKKIKFLFQRLFTKIFYNQAKNLVQQKKKKFKNQGIIYTQLKNKQKK